MHSNGIDREMAWLALEDVMLSIGVTTIVRNISFSASKGEIVCLFGPSGTGKTMVLRAIVGMLNPTSGRIRIDGADARQFNKPIAYVPQQDELLRWRTVRSNIELWHHESKNSQPAGNAREPDAALRLVGLEGDQEKYPRQLSGGMARRTALARGLATNSELMVLDEAFSSVERTLRRKLMAEMRAHAKRHQITTVLVSHDYEEAVYLSDRIMFLSAAPAEIIAAHPVHLPLERNLDLFETEQFRDEIMRAAMSGQR